MHARNTYQLLSGLLFVLALGLIFGLALGLLAGPGAEPIGLLLSGLVVWLIFGLGGGLLSIWDGKQPAELTVVKPVEQIAWSWKRCRGGLIFGLSIELGPALVSGLIFGLPRLVSGLVSGLIFGLICGLLGGLLGTPPTENVRLKPNQGIHASGWNALRLGLIFFLVLWLVFGLIFGLVLWLVFGLVVGLSFGLLFGGIAYFQHYMLRLFLAQSCVLPWRTVPFLEEATDCILLQRVGSGYQFIHPLLQEYFASLDMEAVLGQNKGQT
jgi:hypothetical protein